MNWNEGCIVVSKDLNRQHRRTKGYTKGVGMLGRSLAMVLADWPSKPYASFY